MSSEQIPVSATQADSHMQGTDDNQAFGRFLNSQPVLSMLEALSGSGRRYFHKEEPWEVCLCSLILALEPDCSLQRILKALPYDNKPMDELDFLNSFANLGYYCRKDVSRLKDIDTRLLPGVFISAEGLPYIILGTDQHGTLQFYDPLARMISHVPPSFNDNGVIWFLQRYDENRSAISKFMRKGTGYSWFRALLSRFKGTVAQVMVAGLILNFIALATPLFIMLVYDRVIAAGSMEVLPMLVLGAVIAILFEWKLRHIRSTGLSWLSARLDNIVSNKIFAHLIGLSPKLIERASVAAQIARIKTFESVRDFFSGSVFLSVLEAPFVFIAVIAIATIAGKLVMVPLTMAIGYLLLFAFIRKQVKISIRLAAKASSARQQFTIETFEKLEGIRAHGLSQKWQEKFRHLSGREMMSHFNLSWLGMVAETLAHTLTVIAAVATVGFGVHMVWSGSISTGALVACMILVWRILTPFYSICTMIPRLEQLRNSIIQINDLMDIETEEEDAKSFARLPQLKGHVTFQNVSFGESDDSDETFSNLSFNAKAGDLVTITGSSGSGKASILHLIKSMYRPSHGTIYIDGFDIRQLDAPDLRSKIGYVPSQPNFFSGSIIENIRFVKPLADEKEVIKALELADAWRDVRDMPDGLDTQIGSLGTAQISANLAVRLSLARAYIQPSKILLIDELPNSLLASQAGKKFKDYLLRAKGERTIFICSYRDDLMKISDTIVWLRGVSSPISGPRDKIIAEMNEKGVAA